MAAAGLTVSTGMAQGNRRNDSDPLFFFNACFPCTGAFVVIQGWFEKTE